jgi:hypothetical protein
MYVYLLIFFSVCECSLGLSILFPMFVVKVTVTFSLIIFFNVKVSLFFSFLTPFCFFSEL